MISSISALGLTIFYTLHGLIRLEVLVLDPLFVTRDTLDRNGALRRVEEARRRGQIRQPDETDNTLKNADSAKNDKDVHPLRKAGRDVAHGVAD